jgi:hypothetical protein
MASVLFTPQLYAEPVSSLSFVDLLLTTQQLRLETILGSSSLCASPSSHLALVLLRAHL